MTDPPQPGSAGRLPALGWWLVLVALTAALAGLMELASLPAALLIGSMVAGIVVGVRGKGLAVNRHLFSGAQAIVGVLIATSLSPAVFPSLMSGWPVFLGATAATLAASSLLGWMISRWKVLPGTVGVWGSAPGAATAMVLMAGAFGADQRLVAVMQYLRVIMVSIGAALIARLWVDPQPAAAVAWFGPLEPSAFGLSVLVAAAGAGLGFLVRLPAPAFLGAFVLALVLHLAFAAPFQLPEWLLAAAYVAIGWSIGLKFNADTIVHARRAMPRLILANLVLMAFCGAIAFFLAHEMGIDPLTAYLATSPGGMDSVAIIAAASTGVDITFIMTMQAMRFLIVLLLGPSLARLVARLVRG